MIFLISAILGIFSAGTFKYFPLISAIIALTPTIFLLFTKKYKTAIICMLLSCIGFSYAFFYAFPKTENNFNQQNNLLNLNGYIVSGKDRIYLFHTLKGQNLRLYSDSELKKNVLYSVECKKIEETKNPYVFSSMPICYALKITNQGENLDVNIFKKIQERINRVLEEKLDSPTSSVLIAMTTGHRYEISREIKEDFQKTGLIHLLSISGAHFSLLFTFFFLFFKFLNRFIPYNLLVRMTIYLKPSQLSIILCFPIMLFYFLLIEPNYPSTRAFIMAVLFMIGVLAERKSLWISTVSIACLIIIIIDPSSFYVLSFQLSFLATVAIGFASDIYKSVKDNIKNKLISYLFLSLLISFAATIFTAPVVIYKFHYFSLIAPIANLTVGLLIGMVLFPLNIIFVILYLIFDTYPLPELINLIAGLSFKLMNSLASMSFSSITIPPICLGSVLIFYTGFFLLLLSFYGLKDLTRKLSLFASFSLISVAIAVSMINIHYEKKFLKVTFLDVGQADSAVIETPKESFLIDTGKNGYEATAFLKAKGHKKLTALILTHEQRDHAGGFLRIIDNFDINEIWDNGYILYNPSTQLKVRNLVRGDVLNTENCTFRVLHPYRGFYTLSLERDSNELSLVFTVKCLNKAYLFTADTGKAAISSIPLKYVKADIVKIPHHGSKNSLIESFYDSVNAKICVVSVGSRNPFGHPHNEVIEYLKDRCTIYRTDLDGAIQIKENLNGEIIIKTFEETKFQPFEEWKNLKKLFILW